MVTSRQVVVPVSFLTVLLLAGCVEILKPEEGATISTSSVPAEVGFRSQVCGTFDAVLDGNNVTGQFSPTTGSGPKLATLTNLASGPHTLIASAGTQQYWLLIPYCSRGSATANFCVSPQTVNIVTKTALAQRDSLSWTKTSATTVGVAVDAGAPSNRWDLNRIGGIASSTGLIRSNESSCLCMRSTDAKQHTPIGLAPCDTNEKTQQWQALEMPPGSKTYRFQNSGRGLSDACLTEGPNNTLIQRSCLDTPDQLWSIRDITTGQVGSPF